MHAETHKVPTPGDLKTVDINNMVNKLMFFDYFGSKFGKKAVPLDEDLCRMFEYLLWAEKNNPEVLFQLFDMHAFEQINQRHFQAAEHLIVKNYILIMMNCCEGGLLGELLLEHKLAHAVFQKYIQGSGKRQGKEQILEYVGSFLKAYHRIFNPKLLHLFIIDGDYFELLEVSFQFFNCPEPLTSTTVFNIVLALLKHQEVKNFIILNESRQIFYLDMFENMSKMFRNELVQFGLRISHISKNDDVSYVMSEIEDKIALWEDIAQAIEGMQDLIELAFIKNVLLPLIISPLMKANEFPIFTLKFSLFIMHKILPVVEKLKMLEILLRLLFVQENVHYWPNNLFKAKIPPFKLEKIMDRKILKKVEDEKESYGAGIKLFYQNIFKTKDNHFILMLASLISSVSKYLIKYPDVSKECLMNPGGSVSFWLSQTFINQLAETHCITTLISIINTLIFLSQGYQMQEQLQNQFIYIFKKLIEETLCELKENHKHWDNLIETSQFDLQYVENMQFGDEFCSKKFEQLFKIVFTWDLQKQEEVSHTFYSSIPDTPLDSFRYIFVKFLILRKGAKFLLDNAQFPNLLEDYYSRIITKSSFLQGENYRLKLINNTITQCEIGNEKNVFLPSLVIKDQNFFVLGLIDREKASKEVKIVASIKYKFICSEIVHRKEKQSLAIIAKHWDEKKGKVIKKKEMMNIRGIQNIFPQISAFQTHSREKQLSFIANSLRTTLKLLPKISLI